MRRAGKLGRTNHDPVQILRLLVNRACVRK